MLQHSCKQKNEFKPLRVETKPVQVPTKGIRVSPWIELYEILFQQRKINCNLNNDHSKKILHTQKAVVALFFQWTASICEADNCVSPSTVNREWNLPDVDPDNNIQMSLMDFMDYAWSI